jgi:hypothetical protein
VVPSAGIAPGSTNGGSVPEPNAAGASVTGFDDGPVMAYINPRAHIELSEHDDFLAALPMTAHYRDKSMRAFAVLLRKVWLGALREMYPDFAKHVNSATINLEDEMGDDTEVMEFESRNRRAAERAANKLLREWSTSSKRLDQLAKSSRQIIEKMVRRSITLASKSLKVANTVSDEDIQSYIDSQVGRLIKSVQGTTKDNLRSLLVNSLMEGKDAPTIAKEISDHFDEFPDWRATRIARSETRDAFNVGTLMTAMSGGLRYARAKDAQGDGPTDETCKKRDGKLFTIREALRENSNTHPNDTLEWEPVARADFSIQPVDTLPKGAPEDAAAWFDAKTCTAYVPIELSDDDTDEFLGAVVEHIS